MHTGSGILLFLYGLPAQRILEVGDDRLQGIQPGFGPTLKAQHHLLAASPPAAGTAAVGGAPASEALAVATDNFELIHPGAGVGVEGGDPFVIVEAVVADRIALLPIGEADLIDQPPRVQSHLPQPTSASVRAASH